jgi:hypothetical protein
VLLGYTSFAVATAVTKRQPNFVYVLCDDMNELLGDEAIVKQTRSLIADQAELAPLTRELATAQHSTAVQCAVL